MIPEFIDDIFIYSSSPRSLYLNPEAPDWFTINLKYKPILDLIDGKNDDTIIYNYINKYYEDEKEILTSQIKTILMTSKIFKHNQIQNSNKTGRNIFSPKYIYLTLTDSCNLKCIYCYATERKKTKDTTYETWEKYVSDIIDFSNKPIFIFTGGEPLTVPYVFNLASYIRKRDCECILLTNGTLINNDEIADNI
jgi:sulfatase maturation enzyme AslB (radical SAM superfamily)